MSEDNLIIAGRYRIDELIGHGGMGDVYRGMDLEDHIPVAIKQLHESIVRDNPDIVDRFNREGEMLRRLSHPNIVTILDTVEEGDQHYLIMEYVSGGSLRDLIDEQSRLPIEAVLNVALDLADALTRAHRLGIVHRDIKPDNVLLAEDGTPRLTDFGVAHMADRTRLTQTGSVIGTYAYLSPEACNGLELDERADIWSFGVMLFELLTGRVPFTGSGTAAILTAILTRPAPDLARLRPETPPQLVNLIVQMLEKDRDRRISSVRLVGAELESIIRSLDTPLRQMVLKAGHDVAVGSRFATPSDELPGSDVPAMERSTPQQTHGLSLYPGMARTPTPYPSSGSHMTPGGPPLSTAELAQMARVSTTKWQLIALMVIVTVLACSTVAVIAVLFGPDAVRDDSTPQAQTPSAIPPTLEPVAAGDYIVLVAELEAIDTEPRTVTRFIVDDLKRTLEEGVPFSRVRIRQTPVVVVTERQAQSLADETGATVIIWGNYTADRVDLHVQVGTLDAFAESAIPSNTIAQSANVRVAITDVRSESIAPHVLAVIGTLQGASGNVYEFMRTLAVIDEIDVQLAQIDGDTVAAYTHRFFELHTTDTEAALKAIEGAISKDATNPFSHALRSLALARLGRFGASRDAAETAARLGGDQWSTPLILLGTGDVDTDTSTEYLGRMIAINPNDWYARATRGTIYYLSGFSEEARDDLEAAVALHPDANFVYTMAALQAISEGRFEAATGYIQTILEQYPDPDQYNRFIGATIGEHDVTGQIVASFINLMLGRYEETVAAATTGINRAGSLPDLLSFQGLAYCNLGRYHDAEVAYSQALLNAIGMDVSPGQITFIRLSRADVRLKQGEIDQAREDFARVRESAVAEPALVDRFESGEFGCENLFGRGALMTSGPMSQLEMASTPIPQATPTPAPPTVEPVAAGQHMVLVADLEPLDGVSERDVARFVIEDLERRLVEDIPYGKIAVRHYQDVITSSSEAQDVAQQTGATVIVWGRYTPDAVTLEIQVGVTDAYPYIAFERALLERTANVRVELTNERRESVALHVMNVLSLLAVADGDEFEWVLMLTIMHALQVTPAEVQGSGIAAYTHRGLLAFVSDTGDAVDHFDRALARDGGNAIVYALRSVTHLRLGQDGEALLDIRTAARLGPQDWALPIYLESETDLEQALANVRQIIVLRSDDWFAYFLEAMITYSGLQDLTAARAALEQSIANAPEANLPYALAMLVALRMGDIEQAQDHAYVILTEFPDPDLTTRAFSAIVGDSDPTQLTGLYFGLATNLVLGQYSTIVREMQAARAVIFGGVAMPGITGQQYLDLSDLFFIEAVAYCNLRDLVAAEEAFGQSIKFSKRFALAYVLRAQVQHALLDDAGAAQDYATARMLAPDPAFERWIDAAESGALTCQNLLEYTLLEG